MLLSFELTIAANNLVHVVIAKYWITVARCRMVCYLLFKVFVL